MYRIRFASGNGVRLNGPGGPLRGTARYRVAEAEGFEPPRDPVAVKLGTPARL
jgi:hypothetical protein